MKVIYASLLILGFSLNAFCQKNILCKSGQIILIDGANNFVSSNADTLVNKFKTNDDNERTLLKNLYAQEMDNRLKLALKDKDIAILEYDMKRLPKAEQKANKNKLMLLQKDVKVLNDLHKNILAELFILLKHDKKKIPQLLQKYNSNPSTEDSIKVEPKLEDQLKVEPKDDYADDKIIAPEKNIEQTQNDTILKEKEKAINKLTNFASEDCNILFNGRNNLNKKQTTIKEGRMLSYTPSKMKSYYKLSDFLIINGALEKLDGKTYINIEARFNSKDAMKSYGKIHKTDFLRMEFISGKKIFLTAVEGSEPFLEIHTANSVYKAKYLFESKSDIDILEEEYLDKIGIMWSTGFESYPIYDVDFFHRQLTCLRSAK